MSDQTSIAIPLAIQELIKINNKLLQQYQEELTSKVYAANQEIMGIMGLDPNDGWRVDLNTMTYVKLTSPEDT